ncbi:MAG: putative selenium-dependent hydroxylase accessory protein YqeC [Deltaproteobacteria bacterium]|nr:putative selenium-dependent hydroxylase accessory protein YqeC [Deltaproteobacteria bacterium]
MHSQDIQYLNESLADILGLAGRELVSLVGAGGKTSLMSALARELSLTGQRVVVTTTTRIFKPQGQIILEPDPQALLCRMAGHLVPGEQMTLAQAEEETPEGIKLVGLAPETVDQLWLAGAAEYVLVEADGAKHRPIKAPREFEPVIPALSTVVIGLIGLASLGQALDQETVFGLEPFLRLTGGQPGQPISPEMAARLAAHHQGLFKSAPPEAVRILFLNQAETDQARQAGRELIQIVAQTMDRSRPVRRAVLGSLRTGQMAVFDLSG